MAASASIEAANRVLGKTLLPFTLGHQALLESVGSRFAVGSSDAPEFDDLLISVFICSLPFKLGLTALSMPWFIRIHNWFWARKCGKFDVQEAMVKFQAYLDSETEAPRYWPNNEHLSDDDAHIPWLQFLKQKNVELTGISDREVMDLPYKSALDTWLTHLASSGALKFWSEADYEINRRMKAK